MPHDGVCSHIVIEPVKNYGDVVIAWRCSSCTTIMAHVGACDGCGISGKLPVIASRRYCSDGCKAKHNSKLRKEKASK